MQPSRIGIVTVCYRSMAVLPDMLRTVPDGVPVVLVDNAGEDADDALRALAERHGARLIVNAANRGFGVACNQGAAELDTEFLLFLNPDAALSPDALPVLEAAMDAYPKASAMNPRLRNARGAPYFRRRTGLAPRSEAMPRGWPPADCEVPVLSGAALFVRRRDFEAVGGFDPAIFLYHEDDDLSRRLRAQCGPLMFIRGAEAHHLQGRSTARSAEVAAFKAWHMGRSRVYATRKHGRPFAFGHALGAALAGILSPDNLFSRRRRAKSWHFLRGVAAEGFRPTRAGKTTG